MSYARQAVTRLTLDMGLPDVQKSISVTRGDTNRRLEVTLIDKGSPFALPPDWTAALTGVLPGGDELYESCEVADGRIIFDFVAAPAVSSEEGVFGVSFDVFDEGGEVVASPKLWVHVTAGARRLRDPDTVDRLTSLQEFIGQIKRVNDELAAHTEQIHDAEEALGTHGERLSGLEDGVNLLGEQLAPVLAKYDHLQINRLEIGADVWNADGAATLHYIGKIGGYDENENTKAFAALLVPMDADTVSEAVAVGLEVANTIATAGSIFATMVVKRKPAKDMRFAAVCFTLDNETGETFKASCAIVGVGGGGGGESTGGVDETAVRSIITATLGNVANVRQYSADNPPPYPVTSVNSKTGAVRLTAGDVGADSVGSAETAAERVAERVAEDLRSYYTKTEVNDLVSAIPKFSIEAVDSLPTSGMSSTTVYLVKDKTSSGDLYTEYIYVGGAWEELGRQTVNLSGYVTSAKLTEILGYYVTKTSLSTAINTALAQAKESGEFDGEDGKSAYAYAQDGGYAGTEEEFGEKLAVDTTPFVITVTGNVVSGYTVDKTTAEINAAYSANRPMLCNIDGGYSSLPLTRVSGDTPLIRTFSFMGIDGESYTKVNITQQVSGVIKVTVNLGKYSSGTLKPLTINGTTYDGSYEVNIITGGMLPFQLTMDESTGEWTSELDFETISYVVANRMYPVCIIDGVIAPLLGYDESGIGFALTLALGDAFVSYIINIDSSDSVSVDMVDTTSLPNPHALAIGGTTYDGSEAVDITDTINGMIDAKLGVIENGSY